MPFAPEITTLASIATACGLFVVLWQVRMQRAVATGQFISALDREFAELHLATFMRLMNRGEITADEIIKLLSFFEKLALMQRARALNLELINDLFAYRFFSTVNNPIVQRMFYEGWQDYFRPVFQLHALMKELRQHSGLPIPQEESDLSKYRPEHYKACVGERSVRWT